MAEVKPSCKWCPTKLEGLATEPVRVPNLNNERWMHFCKEECAENYKQLMCELTPLRKFLELPTKHQAELLAAGYEYDDERMLERQRTLAGI